MKSYYPEKDHEGLKIACQVMKRLHQAPMPNTGFPHISDWLKGLDREWDIPAPYLTKARKLRDRLLLTASSPVFLHGDFHHDNILQDGENWVVIDPKGVIGQPVHEVWALMCNPNPDLSLNEVKERLKIVTKELNLDSRVVVSWCFVQSVLSWAWDLEDNLDPSTVGLTEIFDSLSSI